MRNLSGILFAVAANFLWGLVFVVPYALPDVDPFLIPFGRFAAYGMVSLVVFILFIRRPILALKKVDWLWATAFALVGNVVYYAVLVFAIRLAGVAVAALIVGILPVSMAVYGNWVEREFRFRRLWPSLGLILVGIILLNLFSFVDASSVEQSRRVLLGAGLAFLSLAMWTWYGVANARYLKRNPHVDGQTWSVATGITSIPVLVVVYFLLAVVGVWSPGDALVSISTPPALWMFIGASILLGVVVSWLSFVLWNAASRLLPVSLVGQMIVFESISSILYASLIDHAFPSLQVVFAVVITLFGVYLGVRITNEQKAPLPENS